MSFYEGALAQAEAELRALETRRAAILAAMASLRAVLRTSAPTAGVKGTGQRAILEALATGPLTIHEIVESTGGSKKTIEPALSRLKRRGLIENVRTDRRGGYWRLAETATEAGTLTTPVPSQDATVVLTTPEDEARALAEGRMSYTDAKAVAP